MKTRQWLGLYNLLEDKKRSLAAAVGIGFAILLLFMQLGIRAALQTNALLVHTALDFDLLLLSPHYDFLSYPGSFSRVRLYHASAVEGVESVTPIYLTRQLYRNPETRLRYNLLLIGINPGDRPFRDEKLNALTPQLEIEDTVLIDSQTRPEVGPQRVGQVTELVDRRLTVIGTYRIGTGFLADGGLILSDRTLARLIKGVSVEQVQLGLVKLVPGQNPDQAQERLQQVLGSTVQVLARPQAESIDTRQWLEVRPLGLMFTSGVIIGLIVGAVTLYQVLMGEVRSRLWEYATLKALGYSTRYIHGVVYFQAVLFVLLAYFPALALSLGLYSALRSVAQDSDFHDPVPDRPCPGLDPGAEPGRLFSGDPSGPDRQPSGPVLAWRSSALPLPGSCLWTIRPG